MEDYKSPKGSGGTDGGIALFFAGAALCGIGLWLLLDQVYVSHRGYGYLGGRMRGMTGGGTVPIICMPFAIGVFMLFYNSKNKIGWILSAIGLGVIGFEAISGLTMHFGRGMKLWHFLMLVVMVVGGLGMIIRSFRDSTGGSPPDENRAL